MSPRTLCPLLLLVGCSGSSDAMTPDASGGETPREVIGADKMLLVGEIAEGTLHGAPADRAHLTPSVPSPTLDWNLHGHAGGSSQTIQEGLAVMNVSYTFTPPSEGHWNLLIRNKDTAPVTVHVEIALYGDMSWSGW